jgi:hypothetical protein
MSVAVVVGVAVVAVAAGDAVVGVAAVGVAVPSTLAVSLVPEPQLT